MILGYRDASDHFITLCANLFLVPATFGDHVPYLSIVPVSINHLLLVLVSLFLKLHGTCVPGPVFVPEFPHNMQILSDFSSESSLRGFRGCWAMAFSILLPYWESRRRPVGLLAVIY